MQDLLTDVLHDTLSMLPFLYAAYVFMEYLEHKSNDKMQRLLAGTRRFWSTGWFCARYCTTMRFFCYCRVVYI